MNDSQRLSLARDILSSDLAASADDVMMDLHHHRSVTTREKDLARIVRDLYRLIHPTPDCRHPDWEKEMEERLIFPDLPKQKTKTK